MIAYRAEAGVAAFGPIPKTLRVAYLGGAAFVALAVAGTFAACVPIFATAPLSDAALGGAIVSYLTLIVAVIVVAGIGVAWLHRAWSWLPPDQRWSKSWKGWISPPQAALFLFIPYFQFYWAFVVNLGLCDALDRLRVIYPTRAAAPRTLAMIGCILYIVFWPASIIFYYLFMKRVEQMTQEMADAPNARRAAGAG